MLAVRSWLVGGTLVLGLAPWAAAQEGEEKPGALGGFTSKLGEWRDNLFGSDANYDADPGDLHGNPPRGRAHRMLGAGSKAPKEADQAADHDPFVDAQASGAALTSKRTAPIRPQTAPRQPAQTLPPAYGQTQHATPTNALNSTLQQRLAASRAAAGGAPAPAGATARPPMPAAPTQATTVQTPAARVARATAPSANAGAPAPDFEQGSSRAAVIENRHVTAAAPAAKDKSNNFDPPATVEPRTEAAATAAPTAIAPTAIATTTTAPTTTAPTTTARTLDGGRVESGAAEPAESTKVTTESSTAKSGGEVLLEHASPVLHVSTSGPREILVGKEATYHVHLKNVGQAAAEEVAVRVRLPEWTEVAGTSSSAGTVEPGSAAEANSVTWFVQHVEAGASSDLTLRIVARRGKPFDLGIEYSHAAVSSEASVEVKEPKISLAIAGPSEVFYGEHEVYKLTLSNPGTGDAENVVVRLAPTSPEDTAVASHAIGLLKAGDTKVLEIELNARRAGLLSIRAEAVADGGLQSAVAHDVQVRRADLDVQLAGPAVQYAGTAATYEVRIANTGNAPASNLQLAAMLPPGAKFLSATNEGRLDSRESKVVWRLASLRPGAEQVVQFKCQLLQPGANRHQVVCAADGDLRRSAMRTTNVEAVADLTLDVHDPPGPMPVGEDIVYEVIIRNRGTSPAEQVEIVNFFSQGLEPISLDGGPRGVDAKIHRENGELTLAPIATIAPGQEITLRITARANTAGTHTIRTELSCPTLEAKMTEDETTRFFDSAAALTTEEPRGEPPADTAETAWREPNAASEPLPQGQP